MKLLTRALIALSLVGCSTQVKQAHAPGVDEFAESGESDMAAGPEKGPKPLIKNADELKRDCSAQCAQALEKDKTGDDPSKVPCADFTAELNEECLNFFRKTPMMAADAKAFAAEAASKPTPKNDAE
jgi:hypothetical protein